MNFVNDILTAKEIVEICNQFPNAKVSFETKNCSSVFGLDRYVLANIRGYRIVKNSDNEVIEIVFVEDAVIPRNIPNKK